MPLHLRLKRDEAEIRVLFAQLQSRQDVAQILEVPDGLLKSILYIRKEPTRYRSFSISKRNGGLREIHVPPNALAILQAKLNQILQAVYRPRPSVHGFVRERSILTNASLHTGRRWVLNIDIENFFPTINFGRVRGMFKARPYAVGDAAATVLAQICCFQNALPPGAATSPMVANMVCGRLDGEFTALAKRVKATYSRYADDLTFSVRKATFPEELAIPAQTWVQEDVQLGGPLLRIIEANGFRLNTAKSRLQLRDCRQEVTGLTVNIFPNVRRELVRELRAMLHAWDRHGLQSAEQTFHDRFERHAHRVPDHQPPFRQVVKGKLAYIGMVRGEQDPVYVKLRNTMNRIDASLIAPAAVPLQRRVGSFAGLGADPGWTRWFRRYAGGIFQLEIRNNGNVNSGTGFAFRNHILATAAHNIIGDVRVVRDAELTAIERADLHERSSEGVDGALIAVGFVAQTLPLRAGLPDPGESVAVMGFASVPQRRPALGIYPGVVEAISSSYSGSVELIQISVNAGGGLSGSPVIDTNGSVIGIVAQSSYEQTEPGVPRREYSAVLPVSYLRQIRVREETSGSDTRGLPSAIS